MEHCFKKLGSGSEDYFMSIDLLIPNADGDVRVILFIEAFQEVVAERWKAFLDSRHAHLDHCFIA
jgi:hypothetical protein